MKRNGNTDSQRVILRHGQRWVIAWDGTVSDTPTLATCRYLVDREMDAQDTQPERWGGSIRINGAITGDYVVWRVERHANK